MRTINTKLLKDLLNYKISMGMFSFKLQKSKKKIENRKVRGETIIENITQYAVVNLKNRKIDSNKGNVTL